MKFFPLKFGAGIYEAILMSVWSTKSYHCEL